MLQSTKAKAMTRKKHGAEALKSKQQSSWQPRTSRKKNKGSRTDLRVSLKTTTLHEVRTLWRPSQRSKQGSHAKTTKTLTSCPEMLWQHPRQHLLLRKLKLLPLKRNLVLRCFREGELQRSQNRHNRHNRHNSHKQLKKQLQKIKRQLSKQATVVLDSDKITLQQQLKVRNNSLEVQQTQRSDHF